VICRMQRGVSLLLLAAALFCKKKTSQRQTGQMTLAFPPPGDSFAIHGACIEVLWGLEVLQGRTKKIDAD
jgi:hypothetical protein